MIAEQLSIFDQRRYPDVPGVKSADDTTAAAADSMQSRAVALRLQVLQCHTVSPMTADECAHVLRQSVLAVRRPNRCGDRTGAAGARSCGGVGW